MSNTPKVRPFYIKANLHQQASASAYIETNSESTGASTKLSCSFYGPQQLQNQGALDSCQVKVQIEFPDEKKEALLEQLPLVQESLTAITANMPSEAVAEMQTENKLKQLNAQLQQLMQSILISALQTENYLGTQISCTFSVVELDCDLVQAMVNCASVALLASSYKCRCLPVAVTLMKDTQGISVVDPDLRQLQNQTQFAHKIRLVFNVDTEELLSSSMESLRSGSALDFEEIERMMGLGLSAAKKLHEHIIQSQN